MANITLAGTLRDPNGDLAVGDKIRFTHKSTTGETVKSASSILTIDPTGVYSVDLEYGLILVEYKDARNSQFENLGVATVNGTNPATTIPELLSALVPVSSAELIEFQAILADCVAAKDAAEAAAATLDLINDLSQGYEFNNLTSLTSSTTLFPNGKRLDVTGEDGFTSSYEKINTSSDEVITGGGFAKKLLFSNNSTDNFEIIKSIVSRGGQVVITGDSLSYNHQDLDATARSSAELCNPGMRSWSFMLGDIIHKQDAWFKHSDELEWGVFGNSTVQLYNGSTSPQITPFGGRVFVPRMLPAESPVLTVSYKHQGDAANAYFIMHGDPTGFSTSFDCSVDGVFALSSTTKLATTGLNSYQGRDIRHISIPVPNDGKAHVIRFFNFAQVATVPDGSGLVQLPLIGFSSKYTDVAFTGVGGFSTTDLLTQWNIRAVNYNPDVLMLLIGANDSGDAIPLPTFKANLVNMIGQVRATSPNCQFVLMTSPGTTVGFPNSVADDITQTYVNAMKDVCIQERCGFVNLFELFSSVTPDVFRFDWVHLNRAGNTMLCEYITNLMGFNEKVEDTDTDFSLVDFADFNVTGIKGVTGIASPSGAGTDPKVYGIAVKQGPIGVVKSAISTDGATVKITFAYKLTQLGNINLNVWGFFGAQLLTPAITAWGADYVEFQVVKADGLSICQHADYPTLSTSFNFVISYSG